ncbi:recombinase RecX [Weissella paramesenteroides]|jgi:regulatory protein|uniref:Regulatory protein RecX n=2 Tax=Weissella paramesenteroides TaxID=1249 RepID=C5R8F5_WEIPA|nr:recombinase RecX [Weissella paramesenteroides]EER75449.1 regulatory protein RecX [Weissella paramesenteroides ATCC 33313]
MEGTMQTVTKVTRQRRMGRYNIYLDDEYAFAVDEKILITYNLFKGATLDDAAIEQIKSAEFSQKAYTRALIYATGQMRTSQQVYLKLKEQGYDQQIIKDVISRLKDDHVLDDVTYAETYVDQAKSAGKLGPRGVKFKLQQAGIDQFVIEDALAAYTITDQVDALAERVGQLLEKNARHSTFLAEQKTQQKLLQQGFDQRLIQQAISEHRAIEAPDADQEWENLDRDATIAANRYASFEGWEFKNKLKAAMYRKGYDLNLVDRWLKQRD